MQKWMAKEKQEIIKCSSELKERYILLKRVAKVIINEDCIIFGGYIRDTILHYNSAKKFYSHFCPSSYTDPTCDPATFNDRNRVARDIDVYSKEVYSECTKWNKILTILTSTPTLPIKKVSCREMHNYSWHPTFKKRYRVFRYKFRYYYNMCLSTPTTCKTIFFHIDVVFPLENRYNTGPWVDIPDFNINKLYMDVNGIHASPNWDCFEDAFSLIDSIEDIRNRKADFVWTHGIKFPFEESDFSSDEKYRWRAKILERFLLMENRGFHIRNSPFVFHEWTDDELTVEFCNGEDACCISHDVFTSGIVMVKFRQSKSPMTITSLTKLLANPTPSFQECILKWELQCPVSKTVTTLD